MDAIKRILKFTKPYQLNIILMLISAVIYITATLLAPVVIGKAIDQIIEHFTVDFDSMLVYLSQLGIIVLIASTFQYIMNCLTNVLTHKTIKDMRQVVFDKINTLPLSYIDTTPHGDITTRMVANIEQISDGLLQGFTQFFTGIITIIGTIFFMLSLNATIGAVVILVTPLSLLVASFIAKNTAKYFKEQAKTNGDIGGYIQEMISGQSVVKAFGYEQESIKKFKKLNENLYETGVKAQFFSSLANPCTRFVNSVVYASVCVVGALVSINTGLSVGTLSVFLSYANQYTKPFNEISGVVAELQNAISAAVRVFEFLDEPDEFADAQDSIELSNIEGDVEFKDVFFSYVEEKPLLEKVNIHAQKGQRFAIVGPTGCGKTTLINLLMRFYDVKSGDITIDGTNIKNIKKDSLRKSFGMVLQDTWLFSGTVYENIAYGKPNTTKEEVIEAAKRAHAHGFIKRLEHGYDTEITEDGNNISQGQKQLLCIARVMLTNPPMLILDEATSSIDTRTEVQIQGAFNAMMVDKTSFIVAHRLSTIRSADCIIVMKDGKIIEMGTHDEMLLEDGYYADLHKSQFDRTKTVVGGID